MALKPPAGYGATTSAAQTSKDVSFTYRANPQTSQSAAQTSNDVSFTYSANPQTSQSASPTSTSQSVYPTRRPWLEFFSPTAFSVPYDYADGTSRLKHNISYFRVNYTIAVLLIVFLGLLWHPVSMIVFLIVLLAWAGFYFFRGPGPVVLFNRSFDDGAVLFSLSLVTVVALVLTRVGLNVLVSLIVAVVVVGLHAAFRVTEDLYFDKDSSAAQGRLVSVVG